MTVNVKLHIPFIWHTGQETNVHDTLRGEREVGACYDILYNSAWQYIVNINFHFVLVKH